ncbi:hypothetical protein ACJ41P_10355 [Azospirillum argentinense]|uniref:Uncharacterized protein n=1 Tax=Azospirillum argentinense TaxID=2970906 RepID=A0ABW8V4U7_9PROT
MIVVSAAALRSGHRVIQVADCNGSAEAANAIRKRDATLFVSAAERQTVVYDTLADARSGVMRDFGMVWFNLARKQLDNPPVAVGMGAPPRNECRECPECGSDDIEQIRTHMGVVFECCDCGHDFDEDGKPAPNNSNAYGGL